MSIPRAKIGDYVGARLAGPSPSRAEFGVLIRRRGIVSVIRGFRMMSGGFRSAGMRSKGETFDFVCWFDPLPTSATAEERLSPETQKLIRDVRAKFERSGRL